MGSWRLLTTSLVVAFGSSFHSGYFMLVYNVPQDVMESFVNDSSVRRWNRSMDELELTATWSTMAGINQVGRFISCFIAPICADRLGRRNTLLAWSMPAAFGFLLQYLAYPTRYYPLLTVGRLITGIYNGLVGIVVPLFLVEVAISSHWRGAVTRIHNVVTVLGSLAALVLGLPECLGTESRWSWLPLVPLPLLFMEILYLTSVPDSPLQLIESRRSVQEIEHSFRFYLGTAEGGQIPDWRSSTAFGKVREKGDAPYVPIARSRWYLFRTTEGRRLVRLWVGLALAASLAGGSLTNNYSTAILARYRRFSSLAKYSSITINVFKLAAVMGALYSIDRVGRRLMLLFCAWMVMACYVLLMAVAVMSGGGGLVTFARIWFVLVWTSTQYIVNSTAVLVVSESCEQNVRALGLSLFKVVFHVVSVLVTMLFPPVAAVSEVWSYALLALPYAAVVFYLSIVCPETANVDMLNVDKSHQDTATVEPNTERTPLIMPHYDRPGSLPDYSPAGPHEVGPKR